MIEWLRLSVWRFVSVLIFLKVLVKKWVAPIGDLGPERIANRNHPLESEIGQLQERLAGIDLHLAHEQSRTDDPDLLPLIVLRLKDIKIRIDGNKNHKRPHIHIDYKKEYHSASYAIDTGELLIGDLGTQYDRAVRRWIAGCRPKLLELWYLMQSGQRTDAILFELRGE